MEWHCEKAGNMKLVRAGLLSNYGQTGESGRMEVAGPK